MRFVFAAAVLSVGLPPSLLPQTEHSVKIPLNGQVFTLPVGFTIELAAKSPLVDRPITAAFDDEGRLYVGDSSGSNEPVAAQLKKKPHRIVRLEDKNGRGVLDAATVFADGMMFPEGTMWRSGSLYVAAPPSIWKLTDRDGDGVADERVEWFKGKTLTGCANDLHGPYAGPDGWIYWCKGAFAEQTHEVDGKPFKTRAAHIFRARPDGSGIEPVITGGMDNPVAVAFLPGGEPIFTSTFIQYPAGGKRDGLLHAVHGGLYGKEHLDVIASHVWTSPRVMPVMSHLGPAAPSGVTVYESNVFGKAYEGNAFVCQFNLQNVSRHVLTTEGATFRSESSDFVVSDNKDFHPTDVIEDADGSLLIVDTGGWYKLCCPSSQLIKSDILGAIYRVRKVGAKTPDDPRGKAIDWAKATSETIAALLGDPRPAVRRRAKDTLAARGQEALRALEAVLRGEASSAAKREAVWTLVRIDDPAARRLVRFALQSDDMIVRQVALHGISRWRDAESCDALIEIVGGAEPQLQRVAAEGLGRLRLAGPTRDAAARAILKALSRPHDEVLHHSLVYALIEMKAPAEILLADSSQSAGVLRAALIVLEQNREISRRPTLALQGLTHKDASARATAWWIAGRHPEWGESLARFLDELLTAEISADDRADLIRNLASLSRSPAIRDLLAERLADKTAKLPSRRCVLAAMAEARPKIVPPAWMQSLAVSLQTPELIADALAAARALRLLDSSPTPLIETLTSLADNRDQPDQIRLSALAARPSKNLIVSPETFAFVCQHTHKSHSVAERGLAVEILGRLSLTEKNLSDIADHLPSAGPLEVDRLLELFANSKDDAVGVHLMNALETPNLRPLLRVDAVERRVKNFGPAIQKRAQLLYSQLNADVATQRSRLEALLAELPPGDHRKGHAVFYSAKASCIACHTIGYVGGKTGPDLTRIGQIRNRRDLLEAILYPSASFVRGYEPVSIATADGKLHNGLIKSEASEEIFLTTGPNQEIRLPRTTIEEIQPSRVSVMPAGLDQQLSRDELADLIAFLQSCR